MSTPTLLGLRPALWVGLLVLALSACSRAVGGPDAFHETAEKARSTFEDTLDRFGLGDADISVGPTLCQPTTNVALGGSFFTNTEPGEGLAIFNGIRDYWLSLPGAVDVRFREPREGRGFFATRVAIDGGSGKRGGYELYADFDPPFDALSVQVSTGCYRP